MSIALPTHPTLTDPTTGFPLRAICLRRNGSPVWPILGGAEGDPDPKLDSGDSGGGDKPLTMTQAELDAMIGQRLAREKAKFADYDELKSYKDKAEADKASELDKAKAAGKTEGIAEVTARANARIVKADAKAIAADMNFHNASRAAALIDTSQVKVNDDGEPDSAAIKSLLEALAKSDPYLVRSGDSGKGSRRDPGQGSKVGDHAKPGDGGRAEAARRFGKS